MFRMSCPWHKEYQPTKFIGIRFCHIHNPWARYDPRAPPPPHILANLYFFEPLGCPEYEIRL